MAVSLNDVRGMGNPLRSYDFDIIIPNMPGGGDGAAVRIHVTNGTIPGFGVESFESNHHGHTLKHAGRGLHARTWNVEYEETTDMRVYTALRAWRDLQWDPETGVQAERDVYTTTGKIQLLNVSKTVIKTIDVFGLYVEDVPDITLDGAVSDSVKIPVTYSYDFTKDAS